MNGLIHRQYKQTTSTKETKEVPDGAIVPGTGGVLGTGGVPPFPVWNVGQYDFP